MADQRINFRIGSIFSGEGFAAAQKTVGGMNHTVKAGKQAFNALASAMGEMGGLAGKAANALSGLMGAFATGGVAGLAFAGGVTVINHLMEENRKKAEAARKAAEELRKQMDEVFSEAIHERVKGVTDDIKGISDEFKNAAAQANAITAALNNVKQTGGAIALVNLETDKYNAVMRAATEAEKANVSATMDLAIAKEKARISAEKNTDAVNLAQKKMDDAENYILFLKDDLAKQTEMELQLKREADADHSDNQKQQEARQKEIANVENAILETKRKIESAENAYELSRVALNQAIENQTLATRQMELSVRQAADRVDAVAQASEELAKAERKAAITAVANKILKMGQAIHDKAVEGLQAEAADIQKEVNENAKNLAEAERAYAEALRDYEAHYGEERINQHLAENRVFGSKVIGGRMADQKTVQGVAGDIARHETMKELKENGFKNVAALQKFQRSAERDAAKAYRQEEVTQRNDEARANRIMNTSEKARSAADKKWLEDWQALQKQRQARQDELKARQAELDRLKLQRDKLASDVSDINQKLTALGLK